MAKSVIVLYFSGRKTLCEAGCMFFCVCRRMLSTSITNFIATQFSNSVGRSGEAITRRVPKIKTAD